MWVQNNLFTNLGFFTYYYFNGDGNEAKYFKEVYRTRPRTDTVASMNGTYVYRRRT